MSENSNHIESNPFWVLELPWSSTSTEILRQKQKLLGMLELEVAAGKTFDSPSGQVCRDAYRVREAAYSLEDGRRRLFFEFWSLAMPPDQAHTAKTWPSSLSEVMREHQRLRSGDVVIDSSTFEELCGRWEEELRCEALLRALRERSVALGVDKDAGSLGVFQESIEAELSFLLREARFELDGLQSDMAQEAASRYQTECAEELEQVSRGLLSVSDWQDRVEAWVRFREQHRKTISDRGWYIRHLSFAETSSPVSDLANEAFEARYFRFAGQLYAWIRDEAGALGDDSEQERCAFNADLCERRGVGRHLYEMEICRSCASCVRADAFCADCGNRLKPRFCSGCGKPVDRKFCSGCGTRSQM